MYYKDKKIIFIHITKSAGGSVQRAFRINGFEFDFAEEHRTAQQHLEILGKNVFDECFKFSFVRNPWDRMVSIYFYYYIYNRSLDFCPTVHVASNTDLGSMFSSTLPIWDLSFKKWLKAFCLDTEGNQSGHPVRGAARKTSSNLNVKKFHFNQLNWLVSSNATDNGLLVDYIGRVENIQSDMGYVCDKIGIKKMDLSSRENQNPALCAKPLSGKINYSRRFLARRVQLNDISKISNFQKTPTVRKDYSSYYDTESIEIVRNLCKKDIDFFEYEYPFIKKYS